MSEYGLLFLGDIVGRPGRAAVEERLDELRRNPNPYVQAGDGFEAAPVEFIVVNGENSASGVGITPEIAQGLLSAGADAITLGNHWHNKREIYSFLDLGKPIVRPANLAPGNPGKGITYVEKGDIRLAVMNLCGRVFMDSYDDPFRTVDRMTADLGTPHLLVDFHAEATSEKIAFGWHMNGRATAVVGTHTHVTTADETILPGGTAYITDVGMCGPMPSVLGVDKEIILKRFVTGMPAKFEVAEQPGVISGVIINVNRMSGRASAIRRIRIG